MSKWWKRSLSLLLALVMVIGLMPSGLTVRAAEAVDPAQDLNKADGIVWLTKNEKGDNVSDQFSSMVQTKFLLDDMVREALGIEDETTKVYFKGVDVGNVMDLLKNQSVVESLVDEMKESVSNQFLVEFTINNTVKKVAFRNLKAAEIIVGDGNKIYIDHKGAPASADELESLVADALNAAKVSVTHTGTVETTGIYTTGTKARYEATDFVINKGQTYADLIAKWPAIPEADVKKAGTVTVTIYAAEYELHKEDKFKETITVDVLMRDADRATITVKAYAIDPATGTPIQDAELAGYEYTYQAYLGDSMKDLTPVMDNYTRIGWSPAMEQTVTGDATYFAVMKAKVDNNNNGLADQNETFTVTYLDENGDNIAVYEDVMYGATTPEATKPVAPEGKKYIWQVYDESNGETSGTWQAKVYGNVIYKAVLLEGPSVTGIFKFRDGVESPVELFTYLPNHDVDDGYMVEDPAWDLIQQDDYYCTGWYRLVPVGTEGALDLNHDGVAEELPFQMDGDLCYTANGSVELYYEFYTMNNDTDFADGTEHNPLAIYTFVMADGKTVTHEINPFNDDIAEKVPEYITTSKYQIFNGWVYTKDVEEGSAATDYIDYYTVTADLTNIQSEITFSGEGASVINSFGELSKEFVDGVLNYTWKKDTESRYYQASIEISGMTEDYNFIYDANTEITVSPIWEIDGNSKKIAAYVNGLTVDAVDVLGGYSADYSTYNKADDAAVANGPEVVVNVVYDLVGYLANPSQSNSLSAGQDDYTEEGVYNAVKGSDWAAYDSEAVTVQYLARKQGDVTIDLYKLYELFEAEGLGALVGAVGSLPETYTVSLSEKWLNISENAAEELTAQEVTDTYMATAYEKQKAEKFANIEEFINNFLPELTDELEAKALHQFGYVDAGEDTAQEQLKITYNGKEYYASVEPEITIEDNRVATYIEVKGDVTTLYNDSVLEKLLGNVTLQTKARADLSDAVLITKKGDSARDYTNAGVGVYDVRVAFKGNKTYRPAVSEAFKLTVKKVEPTVTVKELIAVLKGTDYVNDPDNSPAAIVTPNAPIIQIVAGVSADELKFGSDLSLIDDTVVIDAWVKLPETYTELLDGLELGTLNGFVDGVTLPSKTVQVGVYYEKEHLEEVLEEYAADSTKPGAGQIQQILDVMDKIPEKILNRLGMNDLNYTLRIRLDALEKNVYPTDAGFYLNYAATLSTFTNRLGSTDKNYGTSDDYGFIVISPMVPIPNRGGVQLYDGEISNAQNVFVYEYNGEKIERDLEVAVNGVKLDGEEPFYYGLTTRFDATKQVPTMPGVYFAGYNYTTEVLNEDTQEMEVRRLGSDSAIIIIKQQEADLEIKGGTYEHDGENHIAEVIVTDKDGNVIKDKGVTVISGTVNANVEGTNVTMNDLYGTVNVDFPDALQNKWDEYCNRIWGEDAKDKFTPSDVISFLEECGDAAVAEANKAIEEFKALAINDTVSAALDKINGVQNRVDVSSGNLVNKAERIQDLMQGGKAYYDKLIAELEPLKNLDDNVWITFYDLATESAKLDYSKTGYYLYAGVITDPDLTVGVGKALVIIHSEDDYIMRDTHVPYDGQSHDIYTIDETKRGDVTAVLYPAEDGVVAINREKKEVRIQVDNELAQVICDALNLIFEKDLNVNSDVSVGTVYTKTGNAADELTEKIMNVVKNRAVAKITADYPQAGAPLDKALAVLDAKLDVIYDKLLAKLQELDQLDNGTKIVISDIFSFDLGTYEVTTFDFDVNEINIQLDGDAFKALKTALAKKGYQLNEGSDGYVITGYEKFEDAADVITEAVFDKITNMANAAFDKTPYDTPEKLEEALEILENKILALKDRFSAKMQQIDGLDNYTRIVINGKLPVEVGTYDFYGYDYDVAATRGKLVIEPIYILVEDEDAWKYVGETDPELKATVSYYSYEGVAPETVEMVEITELPTGVTEASLVSYDVTREAGEEIGKYDISVAAELLNKSGNYVLAEREEDTQDFEIRVYGTAIAVGNTLSLIGEVYIECVLAIEGFEGIDLTNKGGLAIWTGGGKPSSSSMIMPGAENCVTLYNMYRSEMFDAQADKVIPGSEAWTVTTTGINAKELGDLIYMRPFVEVNGNFIYGKPLTYSPEMYCEEKITDNDTSTEIQEVCAALLEYGAAAQEVFDYKTDALVNAGWDLSEFNLDYSEDMIDDLIPTTSYEGKPQLSGILDKVGSAKATLTLEGAIVTEVVYPDVTAENIVRSELLVWSQEDFAATFADTKDLRYETESCTYRVPLEKGVLVNTEGYVATLKVNDPAARYAGIPAKECGDTIYFIAYIVAEENGVEQIYRSKVGYYSPDEYVREMVAESDDAEIVNVCKALAVYSEKARILFDYKLEK